jgi:flagellar biogenesis protein FliO
MDFGLQLLRLAGSLVLVIGLLLACVYGIKRWGRLVQKPAVRELLEVVAKHSFGPKHHLMLVSVQHRQLVLIGVSPQGMHFLSSFAGPGETAPDENRPEHSPPAANS